MEHVICLPVPLQGEQCEFTAGWAPMPSCVRKKNKRGSRPNCASFASGIARRKHTVLVTKYQNSTIDSKRRRLWMNFIFNLCIIFMAEFCVCVCVHECVCAVCACGCICAVSLFRVACAVLLLAGECRPLPTTLLLLTTSLLLQPEPCYPFVDITGCLSLHLHIYSLGSIMILLWTDLALPLFVPSIPVFFYSSH